MFQVSRCLQIGNEKKRGTLQGESTCLFLMMGSLSGKKCQVVMGKKSVPGDSK